MSEIKTTSRISGSREDLAGDVRRAHKLIKGLRAQIEVLAGHRDELREEVIHLQRCWDRCAELLHEARRKSHKLMLRANRLSQGGN